MIMRRKIDVRGYETDVLIMTKKLYETQAKQTCLKWQQICITLTKNRCT